MLTKPSDRSRHLLKIIQWTDEDLRNDQFKNVLCCLRKGMCNILLHLKLIAIRWFQLTTHVIFNYPMVQPAFNATNKICFWEQDELTERYVNLLVSLCKSWFCEDGGESKESSVCKFGAAFTQAKHTNWSNLMALIRNKHESKMASNIYLEIHLSLSTIK